MSIQKTYRLEIEDLVIDVIKKNIKHMNLSIRAPDGRVRIAAPLRVSDTIILTFARSKLEWIQSRKAKFVHKEIAALEYRSGEKMVHLGDMYELVILHHEKSPKVALDAPAKVITLSIRSESTKTERENALLAWRKKELHRITPELIEKWEPIMGVSVSSYGIRLMKTRWGTCNIRTKKIWLNLELTKQPLHCIEYLVVHEMTHLHERLHNARFFGYMDRFLPEWRDWKLELNGGGGLKED